MRYLKYDSHGFFWMCNMGDMYKPIYIIDKYAGEGVKMFKIVSKPNFIRLILTKLIVHYLNIKKMFSTYVHR